MKKIKYDFSIDLYTNKKFDINYYINVLKKERKDRGIQRGVYLAEGAELYYKAVYNKEYEYVLNDFFEVPKCPITNEPVFYKLTGFVNFQQFSKKTTNKQKAEWISLNNKNYLEHVERMKIERKGKGNPAYGLDAWNKGILKGQHENFDKGIEKRKITESLKTIEQKEKTKKKQSDSGKNRLIHGHTGMFHSEETKQILRQRTLDRLKQGKFPQTNTLPVRIFKEVLLSLGIEFKEEFKLSFWSFDFKINNFLIEIQGDYWHTNPNKYPDGPKTKGQKVNFLRDKKKKNFVSLKTKYKLIEFWEYDIINNKEKIELCLKELLNLNPLGNKKPTI